MEIKKKKSALAVNSVSAMLLIVFIALGINFAAGRMFLRLDLTGGRIYSLSKATRHMLANLDDRVIIKAYFSEKLPPPYEQKRRYLENMLAQYRRYARGKLEYVFIDPAKDEAVRSQMWATNITPVRFTQIASDKYEVLEGYMGLQILYLDKQEVIPLMRRTQELEYDLSSRIRKLTHPEIKTIAFLSGHGETDITQEREFAGALGENHKINSIAWSKEEAGPIDADALVVIKPQQAYSDEHLFFIDQFIMRGKRSAFFISLKHTDIQQFYVSPLNPNVTKLLEFYGITIKPGFVLDEENQAIGVQTQHGFMTLQNIVNYPLFPILRIRTHTPITKDMQAVMLPFAHPLEYTGDTGAELTQVFASSEKSWYDDKIVNINPFQNFAAMGTSVKGPFVLGMILQGALPSYFGDREIPEEATEHLETTPYIKDSQNSTLLVLGSSGIFDSQFISDPQMTSLALNIMDWLVEDEALIGIRGKTTDFRPLRQVSPSTRTIIKYGDIFLMPFLIIIGGILRWRRIRTKQYPIELTSHLTQESGNE